jgi:glycosyltransferase involved in cell wall biosynthesis
MRVADIFALPSYVEGLPIALLEAMALGIPSVSTEVYAIPEAIHPEKTGLLIKPGDPQQLADAIRRYLENPEFASKIGQAGRNFVLSAFDERDAADIVLRTYEEEFANG